MLMGDECTFCGQEHPYHHEGAEVKRRKVSIDNAVPAVSAPSKGREAKTGKEQPAMAPPSEGKGAESKSDVGSERKE